MKNVRRISLVLVLSVLILALSGCGEMTTEKLAAKMVQATAGKTMTQMTMDMELEMDIDLEQAGMAFEMGMDMDYRMNMKMQSDPYAAYGDITLDMNMDLLGQNMDVSETMQMYMVMEDGKLVNYTHADSTGAWERQEAELKDAAQSLDYSFLKDMIPEITLDEEKQTLNGREVYVIRLTLTGEQMQRVMNGAGGMQDALGQMGMDGELDMTSLTVPAVFYVDAQSFLPVQIEMEISGMGEMMDSMVSGLLGAGAEGISMKVEIPTCRMVCTNIGFDPVEIPELPAEAKN